MSAEKKDASEKFKKLNIVEEDKEKEEDEEVKNGEGSSEGSSLNGAHHYPGILGENSDYVRLISSDGHEHIIRRELAEKSKTIREMLHSPGGNPSNVVHLQMVDSRILRKICHYLAYQKQYLKKQGEIEPFVIEEENGLELFYAANFFEI